MTVRMYCGNLESLQYYCSIKNLYGSVIKANCFIHAEMTVNHHGLPHYIKKCLPYSNNLHTLLPVLCSLSGNRHRQTQLFDVNTICAGYEALIVGGYKEQSRQDKESYLWEPTLRTGCPNVFALMLFHVPFACLPSV